MCLKHTDAHALGTSIKQEISPHTKFLVAIIIGTLISTSYKNLAFTKSACQKSVDHDVWVIVTWFLNIPVVFIDINPHTKFQVATIIEPWNLPLTKTLTLQNWPKSEVRGPWLIVLCDLILVYSCCTHRLKSSHQISSCYNNRNLNLSLTRSHMYVIRISLSQKSVDRGVWVIVTRFLYISVVLIDINPHTKFQVATIIEPWNLPLTKTLTLQNWPKSKVSGLWHMGLCDLILV